MPTPATRRWFHIVLLVPSESAEDAGAALHDLGCSGVRIGEGEPSKVEAHFDREVSVAGIAATWNGRVESAKWVEEEDWLEGWKKRAPAVMVGRFYVHPSHEKPREGLVNIKIDAGIAFGSGEHPTTRLALLEIEEMFKAKPLGRFLDLGTGSGVLAMAAAMLGAREVVAADTDRRAVETAKANAAANGLTGKIRFIEGSIGKTQGRFDEIVANLTSDQHMSRAKEYRKKLTGGGRIRLGGVKTSELEAVARVTESVIARNGDGWLVLKGADEEAWAAAAAAPPARPVPPPHVEQKADPPTMVLKPMTETREPPRAKKRGAIHHFDINVGDLGESVAFYTRLLPRFGYERGESGDHWVSFSCGDSYLTLVQAQEPYRSQGFHRKHIGVNHIAFAAPSRDAVDALFEWLIWEGISVLYGGPTDMGTIETPNYSVFFEDPDRLKLEYVYRP
jgi:ribosomal protein L11 methyltransferase